MMDDYTQESMTPNDTPPRDPERKYAYKSTLRLEYGLTDTMIDELGPPDQLVANPHYVGGPRAALYLRSRVETWVAANRQRVEKAREHRAMLRANRAARAPST